MLKILRAEQIHQLDLATIKEEKISSTELMERASLVFTDWLLEMFQRKAKTIYIFCGKGNNGGDGLVISRLLAEKGWRVFCYIIFSSKEPSQDFQINYKKLQKTNVAIHEIHTKNDLKIQSSSDAIILDAIFGLGLNKPLNKEIGEIINFLNQSLAHKSRSGYSIWFILRYYFRKYLCFSSRLCFEF